MPLAPHPHAAEDEINRTQKNKATEYHVGQLKARLAKLRTQLLEPGGGGGGGGGFDVAKSGDARVALVSERAWWR
jgi:ribosome-interacting GTPase 1